MNIIQDKETGLWKNSTRGAPEYQTRDQAKQAWIEKKTKEISGLLTNLRNKRNK